MLCGHLVIFAKIAFSSINSNRSFKVIQKLTSWLLTLVFLFFPITFSSQGNWRGSTWTTRRTSGDWSRSLRSLGPTRPPVPEPSAVPTPRRTAGSWPRASPCVATRARKCGSWCFPPLPTILACVSCPKSNTLGDWMMACARVSVELVKLRLHTKRFDFFLPAHLKTIWNQSFFSSI